MLAESPTALELLITGLQGSAKRDEIEDAPSDDENEEAEDRLRKLKK